MSRECATCFRELDDSQFAKRRYGVLRRSCNQCCTADRRAKLESPVPLPAHIPDKLNHMMRDWHGIVDAGSLKGSL